MKGSLLYRTVLIFLFFVLFFGHASAQDNVRSDARFERGDMTLGLVIGANSYDDEEGYLAGGIFNYFVTSLTAPGVKGYFTFGDFFMGEGYLSVDQYFWNSGDLLPFVFIDVGYFYTDLDIEGKGSAQGSVLRGGPGLVYFLSTRAGLRVEGYYEAYLKDSRESIDEFTGFGFSLGLSLFVR